MPSEALTKKATYQSFLWLLALVAVSAIAIWWTKQINPQAVRIVAPLLAVAVMGCSLLLARRVQGTLDEVQLASQAAANYRGTGIGAMAALALLMLPPVVNWLADLVYMLVKASPDAKDRAAMQVALVFGAMIVLLIQTLITAISAIVWWRRVGGAGEE